MVTEVVDGIRAQPLPVGARDVRWVRLDGLHLTLRFLGPTPDERVGATAAAVRSVAEAAAGPIQLTLTGAGSFPRADRPRTLWIGVGGDLEALEGLAARTEAALVDAGWPAESRPFRPHLTLARADGIPVGGLVAQRLVDAMQERSIACPVDRLGLFESVTGGGPARYVPLVLERLPSASSEAMPVYHPTTPDAL
jgi:2'-5' RNA ligase